MSQLLRSILLASFVGALLVGCGAKEAATDAMDAAGDAMEATADAAGDAVDATADAAGGAVDAMADAASSEPGGYVLPEEDRIPGITVEE